MRNWKKAVTFSYDDGVTQDIRLIELFNKYGLKATFNINSELFGMENYLIRDGVRVNHTRVKREDVKHVYQGHEVAVHTLGHVNLTTVDEAEIIRQVELDRENLSEAVGYDVVGMAYPGNDFYTPLYNAQVADVIKNKTAIKYARTADVTKSFELCDNLHQYKGTLYHHGDWSDLFTLGESFLKMETDTPKILYIWGHSYEFDIFPERWAQFEEFCKMISGRSDIFYGTNREVLL